MQKCQLDYVSQRREQTAFNNVSISNAFSYLFHHVIVLHTRIVQRS